MCTGKTHVAAGYPWGVVVASALHHSPGAQIACGVITAGASALNDLDCKGASAARVLGPVSDALSWLVRRYADLIYGATRGDGDPEDAGTHRKATHAIPILLLVQTPLLLVMPYIVAAGARSLARLRPDLPAEAIGRWAGAGFVAAVIGFCLLMVVDRLGSRALAAAAVLALLVSGITVSVDLTDPAGMWHALTAALPGVEPALWDLSPWVVLMVLSGTVCHVVFDEITEGGTPFGAPVVTRKTKSGKKRRWVVIRLPEIIAIETGGWFERWILFRLVLVPAVVLVTPVIGPWVLDMVTPLLPGPAHGVVEALR